MRDVPFGGLGVAGIFAFMSGDVGKDALGAIHLLARREILDAIEESSVVELGPPDEVKDRLENLLPALSVTEATNPPARRESSGGLVGR